MNAPARAADRTEEERNPARSGTSLGTISLPDSPPLIPFDAPLPHPPLWQRITKHRWFSHYNRLIAIVLAANLIVALTNPVDDRLVTTAYMVNFLVTILIRHRFVVNAIFYSATSLPRWAPLRMRQLFGKMYQYGGIHVGAALSALVWFCVHIGLSVRRGAWRADGLAFTDLALLISVLVLLVVIVLGALPVVRSRWHNVFERTHRFGGWSALAVLWAQTVVVAFEAGGHAFSLTALLSGAQFWVLLVATVCVVEPWVRLRRVPITVERPSSHIAVLEFDARYNPFHGSTSAVSVNPLVEWHSFACIDAHGRPATRVFISRAGDWTGRFVDNPPRSLWIKGGPGRAFRDVERLFGKVLFVCTGSGIGPAMSGFKYRTEPQALVWVTRSPRKTYGDALVDEILTTLPESIVIDTRQSGKPDMVKLCYQAVQRFKADAVICVANKEVTWSVVSGLESRGIPAFGPVWDS
ncbi:hypothetical protein [Amycolatopsis pithecellobii]|uniref:Ferredoxin reductase family protein n=1 Tax=Amycolatopsis pithecellobii TaxID=664692 RepID=A0A6N7ZBJ7_9PSEU|nr:hypothetical protein [Amycolatopsis pithecellobii]MTD59141.1 hypothetical protein [Amycolatopsis pithecellobii]